MFYSVNPLVTVIMPVFNCEEFIGQAIKSVLCQTYFNWELIIVNDGSTDSSEIIANKFSDHRIKYFKQNRQGVSSARNLAFSEMRGEYFCFLDSDDLIPPNSIHSRIKVFSQNPDVTFVDGVVITKNKSMEKRIRFYKPSFKGYPYNELLRINQKCLFGPSWMIKREKNIFYHFNERMTHAEDLCFYLSISKGKKYDFTNDEVLHYRISENSAMSNFEGLEDGYKQLYIIVKTEHSVSRKTLIYLKYRITRIMLLSYLFDKRTPFKALRVIFRYFFL